jgi:hypothetical protein
MDLQIKIYFTAWKIELKNCDRIKLVKYIETVEGKEGKWHSRSLCMFVLAYAGFIRNKEISNIKMNNLSFYDTYVKICIESLLNCIIENGKCIHRCHLSIRQSYNNVPVTWLDKYQYLFLRSIITVLPYLWISVLLLSIQILT